MKQIFMIMFASIFVVSVVYAQIGNKEKCLEQITKIENKTDIQKVVDNALVNKGGYMALEYTNPCEALSVFNRITGTKYIQIEEGNIYKIYVVAE